MYSLYRAWFGGGEESYPRLNTLSPPDTVVRVGNDGEYHFVAHRAVLAAHSGYLKALLATSVAESSGSAAASSAHDSAPPVVTSVTVPSTIGGEAFAPLLNYMYTGRLEVTLENIYTVLLATHLLHMPGALEQCRAALLRLRAPPVVPVVSTNVSSATTSSSSTQPAGSVLRPVPNRLLGPAFCWPQTPGAASHLYPPRHLELPHLPALQLPSAISVLPSPIIHKTNLSYGAKERSVSPASSSSQAAQQHAGGSQSTSASPELVVASSASSTSQRSDEPTRPISRGPSPLPASGERESQSHSQPQQQQQTARRRRHSQQGTSHARSRQNSRSSRDSTNERSSSSQAGALQTPGVIYDVACCDGPVRFHRVLNENYAPTAAAAPPPSIQPQQHRILVPQCNGRGSSCRESDEACENDENEQTPSQHRSPSINNNAENSRSGSYTCGYCCHTFKSQHCYQKHARRHLLPTDSENSSERLLVQQQQPPPRRTPPQSEGKKREVRLLDLNVQYYPCKICGSKFPSYYFVHKHRKLCHANVEEPQSRSSSASGGTEDRVPAKTEQSQQPGTSENAQQPA